MTELLLLSESEMARALEPALLRVALESAFIAISQSTVDVPDRITASSPAGMLLAMPGFVPQAGIATKLVTLFPGNDQIGVPTHQGVVTLFDPHTGSPIAVMGAERLTQARTAMSAAIAADLMARPGASVLTIVGAGAQAAGHLAAFHAIRAWDEIRIWNRTSDRAVELAATAENARAVSGLVEALGDADVVALCTHTDQPLFDLADLARGAHVSSVGIGRELPPELVERSFVAVELRAFAETPPPAGAIDLVGRVPRQLVELGELIAGTVEIAPGPDEFTVYKSVGHAAEDCAAAAVAFAVAQRDHLGRHVEL